MQQALDLESARNQELEFQEQLVNERRLHREAEAESERCKQVGRVLTCPRQVCSANIIEVREDIYLSFSGSFRKRHCKIPRH